MNAQGKIARVAKKATAGIELYGSLKAITTAIAAVKVTGSSLQHEVHKIACSVLVHTAKHGNINVLEQFLEALPDMVRKNALQQWFEKYGKVTFGIREGIDKKAVWHMDNDKKPRLGDAMVNPFWKLKGKEGEAYTAIKVDDYMKQQYRKLAADIKAVPPADPATDPRVKLFKSFKECLGGNAPSLN